MESKNQGYQTGGGGCCTGSKSKYNNKSNQPFKVGAGGRDKISTGAST